MSVGTLPAVPMGSPCTLLLHFSTLLAPFLAALLPSAAAAPVDDGTKLRQFRPQPQYYPATDFWTELQREQPWVPAEYSGPLAMNPLLPEWPNTVAICAIMKTENVADVVEWVQYHRWAGVDKVFVRENGAIAPELAAAMQPYITMGFLDFGELYGDKVPLQNRWYNRCSQPDMAGAYSWIGFLDLDEYLMTLDNGELTETPNIKEALKNRRDMRGMELQWIMFGTAGHEHRPTPGGPLAHYDKCTGERSLVLKCMANTYWLHDVALMGDTVHNCNYRSETDTDWALHPAGLADRSEITTHITTKDSNPAHDPRLGGSRDTVMRLKPDTVRADQLELTPEVQLILFHYTTHSMDEYMKHKTNMARKPGAFAAKFASQYGASGGSLPEVFAEFEREFGFDGDKPICGSAVRARYAERIWEADRELEALQRRLEAQREAWEKESEAGGAAAAAGAGDAAFEAGRRAGGGCKGVGCQSVAQDGPSGQGVLWSPRD